MAQGLIGQREHPTPRARLQERIGLLVDWNVDERESGRVEHCLMSVKLRAADTVEDIEFRRRADPTSAGPSLTEGQWVPTQAA
jgi:hypothetical protein